METVPESESGLQKVTEETDDFIVMEKYLQDDNNSESDSVKQRLEKKFKDIEDMQIKEEEDEESLISPPHKPILPEPLPLLDSNLFLTPSALKTLEPNERKQLEEEPHEEPLFQKLSKSHTYPYLLP